MSKRKQINGEMFFHEKTLDAYMLAKRFAGKEGHVAAMPEVVFAKITADEYSPLWTRYIQTTSGEFYGRSRGGAEIVVVCHGIEKILDDENIIAHSQINVRGDKKIKLSEKQFRDLEDGRYGEVSVLDVAAINAMRQYAQSVLSYDVAMKEPLLRARLGNDIEAFLDRHRQITQKESGNDYVITNEHKYHYVREADLYTGGLLIIRQLCDYRRCGGEPSSVSTSIDVSDLTSAGRFIAVPGKDHLINAGDNLEKVLSNIGKNWMKLAVPNSITRDGLYTLMEDDGIKFVMYEKDGNSLDTGLPEYHVDKLIKAGQPKTFRTIIHGYYGFFRYYVDDVKKIAPPGANAYMMGEPEFEEKTGEAVHQIAPIQFYHAAVDMSKRILKPEEIKDNIDLVRRLLS